MKKIFGFRGKKLFAGGEYECLDDKHVNPQYRYTIRDKDLGKIHRAAILGNVAKVQQLIFVGNNQLNDRDKANRTALHLASAFGRPEVVTLLVERKCQLDLFDSESRTALIKAVQYQREECVNILLRHGADPNLEDINGNTALHYAVCGENLSIVANLMAHDADTEAKNKDDLTPLLLAINENRPQMVDYLRQRKADVYALDKAKRSCRLVSDYKAKMNIQHSPGSNSSDLARYKSPDQILEQTDSSKAKEKSEEVSSISSASGKPGLDSWPSSEDFDFDVKSPPKINLRKLITAPEFWKNIEEQTEHGKEERGPLFGFQTSENKDKVQDIPDPDSPLKPSLNFSAGGAATSAIEKEENGVDNSDNVLSEQENTENLSDVDEANQNTNNLISTGLGEDDDSPWDSESISESGPPNYIVYPPESKEKKEDNKLCGHIKDVDLNLPIEEEKNRCQESGSDQSEDEKEKKIKSSELEVSENIQEAGANNNGYYGFSQQGKNINVDNKKFLTKKNEGSNSSTPDLNIKDKKKYKCKKWTSEESTATQMLEKTNSATGVLQENDDQSFSETDEPKARLAMNKYTEKSKIQEQVNSVYNSDNSTQSLESSSEDSSLHSSDCKNSLSRKEQLGLDPNESVNLMTLQDTLSSYKKPLEYKKNHCGILTKKHKKIENKVSRLQNDARGLISQLEHENREWERDFSNLRFALKQEKEKRRNADILCEKIRDQLRKKEEQYSKEVEMKQQLEITLRTLDMELKTVRNNLDEVVKERNDAQKQLSREQNARVLQDEVLTSHLCKQEEIDMVQKKTVPNFEVCESHEKEKDLVQTNQMLQNKITLLTLELDTLKNQGQVKAKQYAEDIEITRKENHDLQKTLQQNEATLANTVSQHNEQLKTLSTENAVLKSRLENEKQINERLETEVESYRSRLTAVTHDYDQSQTSKRDLEIAFQRAKDEWFHLQNKMNFDFSTLKENNDSLSQHLSKTESKLNSLEIEFQQTKDALREKTLDLERVERDLSQTQRQLKKVEHMYQGEQGKVRKYIGRQESFQERLSVLDSENMLLRQQLDEAHTKVINEEKTVIDFQDKFHDIVKKIQIESEKQSLILKERNKELINECNHLKEQMCQYENEKTEREVTVRQLQQELADTLKKQSMSEASLEVVSHYRTSLEDEKQALKEKLGQITCQLEEAQNAYTEAVQRAEKMQEHLQKLEIENAQLKVTLKMQMGKAEHLQQNLLHTSSSEDEEEPLKKRTLKQSLASSLDQELKKNELEKEITGLKKLLKMKKKLQEYENKEFSFNGDLKTNQIERSIEQAMLKHKMDDLKASLRESSSKYLHLDAKYQALQQEFLAMKTVKKKCEKLEKNKKKLEQEIINLRSHLEGNMIDHSQVEQYKRAIEERARQEIEEKLKEVNLFLQTQAISQEYLEKLKETNNASTRTQMEFRIKELESELCKIKTFQDDFNREELKKYKELYEDELRVRKAISSKLNNTNEKLAEMNTKLLIEKQHNRSLLSTLSTLPVLESPCVGNVSSRLLLNNNITPKEHVWVTPKEHALVPNFSKHQPSNDSMDSYLTEMRQELDKIITKELQKDAPEFESASYRASCLGYSDKSTHELLVQASEEYVQVLRKKYKI